MFRHQISLLGKPALALSPTAVRANGSANKLLATRPRPALPTYYKPSVSSPKSDVVRKVAADPKLIATTKHRMDRVMKQSIRTPKIVAVAKGAILDVDDELRLSSTEAQGIRQAHSEFLKTAATIDETTKVLSKRGGPALVDVFKAAQWDTALQIKPVIATITSTVDAVEEVKEVVAFLKEQMRSHQDDIFHLKEAVYLPTRAKQQHHSSKSGNGVVVAISSQRSRTGGKPVVLVDDWITQQQQSAHPSAPGATGRLPIDPSVLGRHAAALDRSLAQAADGQAVRESKGVAWTKMVFKEILSSVLKDPLVVESFASSVFKKRPEVLKSLQSVALVALKNKKNPESATGAQKEKQRAVVDF